jgi:hypothetical protein
LTRNNACTRIVLVAESLYSEATVKRSAAVWTLILLMSLSFLVPHGVRADGMLFEDEAAWKEWQRLKQADIMESAQKAIILFSKGTEDLIISPSYDDAPERFVWIVPVPSRPKVRVVEGAIFHELEKAAGRPEIIHEIALGADQGGHATVSVLERKAVGAYEVAVLQCRDGGELTAWLRSNGYHVTDQAVDPIHEYARDGWTFVACKVRLPKYSKSLRKGALAPLRLTFPSKTLIYPSRFPPTDGALYGFLIYVLVPTSEIERGTGELRAAPHRSARPLHRLQTVTPSLRDRSGSLAYPALARLTQERVEVFAFGGILEARAWAEDFTWEVPRRSRFGMFFDSIPWSEYRRWYVRYGIAAVLAALTVLVLHRRRRTPS